jgi:hypothetical protein
LIPKNVESRGEPSAAADCGAGGLIPENVESGCAPGSGSLAPAHNLALRAASSRARGLPSPHGRLGAGGHAHLPSGVAACVGSGAAGLIRENADLGFSAGLVAGSSAGGLICENVDLGAGASAWAGSGAARRG